MKCPTISKRHVLSASISPRAQAPSIDYRSPHKMRHCHAVYALKRARNIAEYKAVSQNLMHTTLATTDTIYGVLTGSDVQSVIRGLTGATNGDIGNHEIIEKLEAILKEIRRTS